MEAAGAASHSDHGRDLVDVLAQVGEGNGSGYQIRDAEKLKKVAVEFGVDVEGKDSGLFARFTGTVKMDSGSWAESIEKQFKQLTVVAENIPDSAA